MLKTAGLKITVRNPHEFGIPPHHPNTNPEGYQEFRSSQTSETLMHPFCVRGSMLRCSNLIVSLLNETTRTGSRIYIEHTTQTFFKDITSLS